MKHLDNDVFMMADYCEQSNVFLNDWQITKIYELGYLFTVSN